MFIPSITLLTVGIVLAGLLMVADWFVWGLTYTNNRRRDRVKPLGAVELVDGFLHRMIAANEAVLPCAALKAVHAKPAADDGHDSGFKHVA
jgi:hypothetical protein